MTLALTSLCAALLAAESAQAPPGWFVTGKDAAAYTVKRLDAGACSTHATLALASTRETRGNATIMQVVSATSYLGGRLRFAATVRTEHVTGWAGLWMRVDGADPRHSLAFDNMQNRPLVGDVACSRVSVVLDVPADAKKIALGLLLEGEGRVELTELEIGPVDERVPVTRLPGEANDPTRFDGRIGELRFTEQSVHFSTGAEVMHQVTSKLWANSNVARATLSGNALRIKLDDLEGSFEATSKGDLTSITGTWGRVGASPVPVSFQLSHDLLEVRVDRDLRRLVADQSFKVELGCVRFVSTEAPSQALIVCQDALEPGVGFVQKTVALLLATLDRDRLKKAP